LGVHRRTAVSDTIDDLFRRFGRAFNKADVDEIAACVTGIDAKGQPFDRYGIALYELKDGKISLKDSYLKVD
jgi:hypothetical protein